MQSSPSPLLSVSETSFEAEVVPGLERFAAEEIATMFGHRAMVGCSPRPGNLPFAFSGDLSELSRLRVVNAVYAVLRFDVPRPAALLGHQSFTRIKRRITEIRASQPRNSFRTFRVSAAGSGSSVFRRLRSALASETGLEDTEVEGDVFIRVRRPLDRSASGFEVSIRLTPRPLSARPWRVCSMPGALNAAAARVMAQLTEPGPEDVFLNLACGSGSIMIERLDECPAHRVIGIDIDGEALRCAAANLAAASVSEKVEIMRADAASVPLPDRSVSALCADLPFGHLVGSHGENEISYSLLLHESARVAVPGAKFVLLTSEVRLMETAVRHLNEMWSIERDIKCTLKTDRVRMYVLVRQ